MPRAQLNEAYEPLVAENAPTSSRRKALAAVAATSVAVVATVCVVVALSGGTPPGGGAPSPRPAEPDRLRHSNVSAQFALWHEKFRPFQGFQSAASYDAKLEVFGDNLDTIDAHNARFERGEETFNMTVGPFADMTVEAFTAKHLIEFPTERPALEMMPESDLLTTGSDSSIDYRSGSHKYVTKVKNQGSCGSCWAFSAAAAVEGAWAKAGHGLVDISPQSLVDCDTVSDGCDGGWPSAGIKLMKSKGFATESKYPYQGTDYYRCASSKFSHKSAISGPYSVPSSDDGLYSALHNHGPISVALDATVLQHYHSGVVSSGGSRPNHAVLLVGMESRNNAWIIKNSWDKNWGENGYFRLKRKGGSGTLGVNTEATYATAH